jgi:peptidoglycan/LPS O-acetylase OafA/YrhL
LAKRALRIFPGLLVCTVLSVVVLGPWLTTLDMATYWRNEHTRGYFTNLVLYMTYHLPGVFAQNKLPHAVNGSLWSLPIEFLMYLLLALLGLLGTVIGMIEIFSAQGTGVAGTDNPVQLAQGISIALYNTAFGLIVAIPSLIFWRYFRGRIEGYVLQMELASERFARHLNSLRQSP